MNKAMKKFRMFFAVALLFCVIPLQNVSANAVDDVSAPSWAAPIDYLALGDSLAAGMDPSGGMGAGYPDHLAKKIEDAGLLTSFSNDFSYQGYSTENVLRDLTDNVTRDIGGSPVKLHDAIAGAEFITISAGANDVLPLIKFDSDTGAVVNPDMAEINNGIRQVGINVLEIVVEINEINPKAQVYVMGYYNPFPHMPKEIQPFLNDLVDGINTALVTVTDNPKLEYVATKDVIAESPIVYLPNPSNIHLSKAGYQKVAEQFWNKMETAYPWVSADSLTVDNVTENTMNLNWKPAIDDVKVISYEVYQGTKKLATVGGDVLSYKVEGLTGGTTYSFSVVAVDKAGIRSIYHPETTVETKKNCHQRLTSPTLLSTGQKNIFRQLLFPAWSLVKPKVYLNQKIC